jgi:hypothetical protein
MQNMRLIHDNAEPVPVNDAIIRSFAVLFTLICSVLAKYFNSFIELKLDWLFL